MSPKLNKIFSFWFSVIAIFSLILSPLYNSALAYNQPSALNYLQAHSTSAWSTLGQVALGSSSVSSDYLKNISGNSATDFETPIIALAALGKDPKTFGSTDYVAKLKTFFKDGQIGDPSSINDDIFGSLALVSAKTPLTDEVLVAEKNYILGLQNSDGGWALSIGGTSDSNTTALAIVALTSLGVNSSDNSIANALNYLKGCQNSDGGFTYDPHSPYGSDSDSSSTSWVLWALNSLGINQSSWSKNGHSPYSYLETNQTAEGFFSYQTGSGEDSFSPVTTAYAAIALSGKTLPIFSSQPQTQLFDFRIEGSAETVCAGQAQGPTALDIIKNAAVQCGFNYSIKQMSFGPYLSQIENDTASGQTGWMYLVNNVSPDAGASDYQLEKGDQVLWYFGVYGWPVTRLSASQTEITSGQNAQALVEYYKDGSWFPLDQAMVTIGGNSFNSDSAGNEQFTAPDGYYKISAQKSGYIRSNQVLFKFGSPNSSSVNLTANISGEVQGTSTPPTSTISFTVDATNLDFGNLTPNSPSEKQLTISNTGSVDLNFNSSVSGDPVFTNYLNINNKTWQNFKTTVNAKTSEAQTLKLSLPTGFPGAPGQKSGKLIFWASVK
ncbi:MAG: DUF4430 domain-containing protein [Candidatus Doudnabacteria bacterium]|nr:DUF4430 domain-containing protein [Candidatus Doudnabacteria bacterium]